MTGIILHLFVSPSARRFFARHSLPTDIISVVPIKTATLKIGPVTRLAILAKLPGSAGVRILMVNPKKMEIVKVLPAKPETIAAIFGNDINELIDAQIAALQARR